MENTPVITCIKYLGPNTNSVSQVAWLFQDLLKKSEENISRSDLSFFVDEITKLVINWIGKGEDKKLKQISKEFERILSSDIEFDYPLRGFSNKRKFGIQLSFIDDLINTYLDSDLELKDFQHIMLGGKVAERLRRVLFVFFKDSRRLNVTDLYQELHQCNVYDGKSVIPEDIRKLLQRDLDRLLEYRLIRRVQLSPKKLLYEATPRAYSLKPDIEKLMQIQNIGNVEFEDIVSHVIPNYSKNSATPIAYFPNYRIPVTNYE